VATTSPSPTSLVDRLAESRQLDRLLVDARSGTSGTVVIRGEAGVGKTALVEDLLARASGCRIVRVSGVESEMELPFAGLHLLCAPFRDSLDRLPIPQQDALRSAFGERVGDPPDRFLVGLAVLSLLSEVAESQPLVCLIDDAQWFDRASAQVIGFVARRLAAEAIVIILAVREPYEATDFAGLPELGLGPLGERDARAVLESAIAGRLDASVRDRIVAEARGNPLALLELPRAWTPAAIAGGFGSPGGTSVSSRIEESFRRRLTPLPDDTRRLLLLAAADPVGDPGTIWAAADRMGIPADAASAAVAAGLLDPGHELRFRHPVVRTVVYQDAPIDDRRLVHGSLADVTDAEADPDRRVWHLATATAGFDEVVALELERSASRAQARGGIAAAAAFLARAVDLTRDRALRATRALAAANASLQAGALDAALGLVATAEAASTSEDQLAQVDLLRGRVAMASFGSDAAELLLRAARRLETLDLELARHTYLLAWGGTTVTGQDDVRVEISQAVRSLPRADRPGPLDLLLDGVTLLTLEGPRAAIPRLQRAAEATVELPLEDILDWGWAAVTASFFVWDEELQRATSERQISLLREAGALAHLPIVLSGLGVATAWTGDLAGAAVLIAEGQTVAAATGTQIAPYTALRIAALRGRESDAVPMIDRAIEQFAAIGQGLAERQAHGAAAVLYNGLGRYEEAAAAAARAVSNRLDYTSAQLGLPELVEAAAHSGDAELARDAHDRLAEMTLPCGTDYPLGIEARARGLVSVGPAVEQAFREAIDHLGRTRMRPDLARAHLVYGEWLRREGRRVDARAQLRTAYDTFVVVGMEAFAERARRELDATGETVRKRTPETADQLTPQELQIARLAAEGRTNAEIGAQLFLSVRTIEWHLRKVFVKLDLSSRRELPDALQGARR
jgi:DNA-binding CsgD family transcriptional regulator